MPTNLVAKGVMPRAFSQACAVSIHANDDSEHCRDKNNMARSMTPFGTDR